MNRDYLSQSFEPMDIDISAHSSNDMDISFNDIKNETNNLYNRESVRTPHDESKNIDEFLKSINESLVSTPEPIVTQCDQPPQVIKKFHIKMQKENASTYNTKKVKLVCSALVVFLAAMAYQVLNIQCSDELDTNKLRNNLSYRLFGQTNAINVLIEGLSANEQSKLLILYGGTGVGKTFATSMLLEHLGLYSNVYHYTMPSFMNTFTTDFMVGLTVCKKSIIIVDDLCPNDSQVKVHIKNIMTKSKNLDKDLIVLLIYNFNSVNLKGCETFSTTIMDNFKEVEAYKKMIRFDTLHEEHLRKCIEAELRSRKVSDNEFRMILKNFNVTVDGCKGVHRKMKFLDVS